MCICILCLLEDADFPFVCAHNRDENPDRPCGPCGIQEDHILCSRDQRAGGTVMGFNTNVKSKSVENKNGGGGGAVCVLTNARSKFASADLCNKSSRGLVVIDALKAGGGGDDWLHSLQGLTSDAFHACRVQGVASANPSLAFASLLPNTEQVHQELKNLAMRKMVPPHVLSEKWGEIQIGTGKEDTDNYDTTPLVDNGIEFLESLGREFLPPSEREQVVDNQNLNCNNDIITNDCGNSSSMLLGASTLRGEVKSEYAKYEGQLRSQGMSPLKDWLLVRGRGGGDSSLEEGKKKKAKPLRLVFSNAQVPLPYHPNVWPKCAHLLRTSREKELFSFDDREKLSQKEKRELVRNRLDALLSDPNDYSLAKDSDPSLIAEFSQSFVKAKSLSHFDEDLEEALQRRVYIEQPLLIRAPNLRAPNPPPPHDTSEAQTETETETANKRPVLGRFQTVSQTICISDAKERIVYWYFRDRTCTTNANSGSGTIPWQEFQIPWDLE